MASHTVAIANVLILLSVFLLILISIGVYVYRDAKQRGMNAALWALIAVLTPSLLGFIIYLLVRKNHTDLKCPACMFPVAEQFVVCPKCGGRLKCSCPGCSIAIEPDWNICPHCTASLPEHNNGYAPPLRKKDTALSRILLMVVLIPMLFVFLLIVFYAPLSFRGSTSALTMTNFNVVDFERNAEIMEWINKSNENPVKIYALSYKTERGGILISTFLIYNPATAGIDSNNNTGSQSGMLIPVVTGSSSISATGLFRRNIELRVQGSFSNTIISHHANRHANLRLYVNGRRVRVEISEVDFDPLPLMRTQAKD